MICQCLGSVHRHPVQLAEKVQCLKGAPPQLFLLSGGLSEVVIVK